MKSNNTTQEFIPIKEIRDGVAILKDGSMKGLLMTSSLNFALKSLEEQESIIFQFQNFLNSLDFSVQIFIQSRRLDIRPYLNSLELKRKDQINDLMKLQIKEYIDFVRAFTESVNIMTKNFFIVVSYTPPALDLTKSGANVFEKKQNKVKVDKFEEDRSQLEQRMSIVKQGIVRTGVRVAQLGTEELIEVYYKIFNPGDTEAPIIET